MTIIVAPPLILLLLRIKRHYVKIARETGAAKLRASKLQSPVVIVPIDGWNRVAEKAVRFGLLLSDDVTAVHVSIENDCAQGLKELWADKVEKPAKAAKAPIPRLEIIASPYRMLHQPILDFVKKAKKEKPDRLHSCDHSPIGRAALVPVLAARSGRLKAEDIALYGNRDQRTVVISTPWYLREETADSKK